MARDGGGWLLWFSHSVMPEFCDAEDCSPPVSSVHGISQARILDWVAISFSRGTSQLSDQLTSSALAGRFFIIEPPEKSGGG